MRTSILALITALVATFVTACGTHTADVSRSKGTGAEDPVVANIRQVFSASKPPKAADLVYNNDYSCISHVAQPGQFNEESGYVELKMIGTLVHVGSLLLSQSLSYELHDGQEAIAHETAAQSMAMRLSANGVLTFEESFKGPVPAGYDPAISEPTAVAINYLMCQRP